VKGHGGSQQGREGCDDDAIGNRNASRTSPFAARTPPCAANSSACRAARGPPLGSVPRAAAGSSRVAGASARSEESGKESAERVRVRVKNHVGGWGARRPGRLERD